jgi:uncharacterized membrane protein
VKLAGGWLRLAALAALACLALLPLLPVLGRLLPPIAPLERAAYVWFDLHCHRDPARTLHLLGVPLAVCARCSGIYFGLGAGALLRRPHLTPRALRLWVAVAALLMIADVALETYAFHGPWWLLRLTTGTFLGYPVGVALGSRLLVSSRDQPARLTTDNSQSP